jgi:hypothetical protein
MMMILRYDLAMILILYRDFVKIILRPRFMRICVKKNRLRRLFGCGIIFPLDFAKKCITMGGLGRSLGCV